MLEPYGTEFSNSLLRIFLLKQPQKIWEFGLQEESCAIDVTKQTNWQSYLPNTTQEEESILE